MPDARHLLPAPSPARTILAAAIRRRTLDAVGDWATADHGAAGLPDIEPALGMTLHEYTLYHAEHIIPAGYRPPGWRGDEVEVREEVAHHA
jgi:hypothetical protein